MTLCDLVTDEGIRVLASNCTSLKRIDFTCSGVSERVLDVFNTPISGDTLPFPNLSSIKGELRFVAIETVRSFLDKRKDLLPKMEIFTVHPGGLGTSEMPEWEEIIRRLILECPNLRIIPLKVFS